MKIKKQKSKKLHSRYKLFMGLINLWTGFTFIFMAVETYKIIFIFLILLFWIFGSFLIADELKRRSWK